MTKQTTVVVIGALRVNTRTEIKTCLNTDVEHVETDIGNS